MKQELLRDLAIRGGIYDCICDPYDKLNNGDPYSSVMIDLERFAEKIVKECIKIAMKSVGDDEPKEAWYLIQEHFGVEE